MSAEIIAIGWACIDHLSIVTRLPDGGEDCGKPLVQGGGPAATGAVAAARLGADVELWSFVGDDFHGQHVRRELSGFGVDVSQCKVLAGKRTPSSFIEVDSLTGDRTIYGSQFLPPDADTQTTFDFGRVAGARALLVTEALAVASTEAAKAAKAAGCPVVADLFRVDGACTLLVPLVDALVLPEETGARIAGGRDFPRAVRMMAEMGPSMPVVTVGSGGSYYLADGKVCHCPAFKVSVVDTTGCGDSFHGAFAFALARGYDVHECVRFSSAVAALKATKLGGRTGLPRLAEVEAFLAARPDAARAVVLPGA
jgi:sugar/nucleoside kinase (ribokinase family)